MNTIKNIKTFTQYIKLTEEACKNSNYAKIELNMSAVLDLKAIRCYEIQYFKKYGKNGIACIIFEQMLATPASKIWDLLIKEMVLILCFWLKAMKELLKTQNWWMFMKRLLTFTKEIKTKDVKVHDILVEQLTDYLLHLATHDKTNVWQKYEIIHCLNIYCAESSRHIRYELRNEFEDYFIKLSSYMSTCGHLPYQFSVMETLLRWLIPRNDQKIRAVSADNWFRRSGFSEDVIKIFMERSWINFFQDVRDFLNAHNETSDLIVSVKFSTMKIGEALVIPEMWLDVNSATECLIVLLLPRMLRNLQPIKNNCSETLVIRNDNIQKVTLIRKSLENSLLVKMTTSPTIEPSLNEIFDENVRDLVINLDPGCDFKRLDAALRSNFGSKYEVNFDLDKKIELSSSNTSRSPQIQPPKRVPSRIGEAIFSTRKLQSARRESTNTHIDSSIEQKKELDQSTKTGSVYTRINSKPTSTTSTTSLKLLRDILDAKPIEKFNHEIEKPLFFPYLSTIAELDECNTTAQSARSGACYSNNWKGKQIEFQTIFDPKQRLLPNLNNNDISCLTVCNTKNDVPVIIDTLERISKTTDFDECNIVDLLLQESYERTYNEKNDNFILKELNPSEIDVVNFDTIEKRMEMLNNDSLPLKKKIIENNNTTVTKEILNFNQVDIEQCLEEIIDQVSESLDKANNKTMTRDFDTEDDIPLKLFTKKKVRSKDTNIANLNTTSKIKGKKENAAGTNNVTISHMCIHNSETHINIFSDQKPKKNSCVNRKRKLYSSQSEQMDREISKDENQTKLKKASAPEISKHVNMFYQGVDGNLKTKLSGLPKRKNRSKQIDPPSPTTVLQNKKFDQLKETQDHTCETYADKEDCRVFDFTSDSDWDVEGSSKKSDDRIAKKKNSSINKTTIDVQHQNKPNDFNNIEHKNNQVNKKKRIVGKRKPAAKKNKFFTSKVAREENDLVDEKMRNEKATLNTSFVFKKPTAISNDPLPVLNEIPEMEFAIDNANTDIFRAISATSNKQKTGPTKRKLPQKKTTVSKRIAKFTSTNLDKTESPLPELTVESILPQDVQKDNTVVSDNVMRSLTKGLLQNVRKPSPNIKNSKESEIAKNIKESKSVSGETIVDDSRDDIDASRLSVANTNIESVHIKKASKQLMHEQYYNKKSLQPCELSSFNSVNAHFDSNKCPLNTPNVIETSPRRLDEYDSNAKEYYKQMTIGDDNVANPVFEPLEDRHEIETPGVSKLRMIYEDDKDSKSDRSDVDNFKDPEGPWVSLKRYNTDDLLKFLPSSRSSSIRSGIYEISSAKQRQLSSKTEVNENDINADAQFGSVNKRRPMSKSRRDLTLKSSHSHGKSIRIEQSMSRIERDLSSKSSANPCSCSNSDFVNIQEPGMLPLKSFDKEINDSPDNSIRIEQSMSRIERDLSSKSSAIPCSSNNSDFVNTQEPGILPLKSFDKEINDSHDHSNRIEQSMSRIERDLSSKSSAIPCSSNNSEFVNTHEPGMLPLKSFDKESNEEAVEGSIKLYKRVKRIFRQNSEQSTTRKQSEEVIVSPIRTSTPRSSESYSLHTNDNNISTSGIKDCSDLSKWRKKNESTSTEEKNEQNMEDIIENVCEDLNKKISELTGETKEKFKHLYVEMIKQMDMIEEERKKEVANIIRKTDEKYKQLKSRFIKDFDQIIVEVTKQKQQAVQLLEEDIRAVAHYYKQNKK